MNDSGTLWIDLTMLAHWQGQLTGIQRVEYNLARRFAQRERVRFCVFDKSKKEFFEYDFHNIETKVVALQVANGEKASAVAEVEKFSLRQSVSPWIPRIAKRSLKVAGRVVKKRINRNIPQMQTPTFNKSDKMLILSGDWSDDVFATTITTLKSECGFKLTQIVYDLLPATQPAFFVPGMPEQVSNYMAAMFRICDSILAISEATKKDILAFQKLKSLQPCKVHVFRLGEDFVKDKPLKPQLSVEPGKFVLSVGTVEARKNHMALYYMVREAVRVNMDIPTVVIAGKHGWLVDNFLYLVKNDPIINQKIIFLPNGTDRELAWLFQNCLLTMYQSFYEGWGLPIAESLYYGKLCLASNNSSMPEIAGDLVDYYSPNNPDEMLACISKYLNNPNELIKKERQIKEVYAPTSWDATFKEVEYYLLEL
jgi:glycosyltransferase involved in cell wall biosynthesis